MPNYACWVRRTRPCSGWPATLWDIFGRIRIRTPSGPNLTLLNAGAGWFLWTMKTEDNAAPEWDFLFLVEQGVIPQEQTPPPLYQDNFFLLSPLDYTIPQKRAHLLYLSHKRRIRQKRGHRSSLLVEGRN